MKQLFKNFKAITNLVSKTAAVTKSLQDNDIPIGDIQFYNNYIPAIKEANYLITVTPMLSASLNASTQDLQPAKQAFSIQGPRFELPSDDIHAMSPAPQSSGEYDTHLPHIVFSKRALPWERAIGADATTPWLALLVFTAEELQLATTATTGQQTGTVADFLKEESDTLKPQLQSVTDADSVLNCNTIKIPSVLFTQIAPRLTELTSMAHCRQINTGDKEILGLKDDGWFSVVVANRFPTVGQGSNASSVKNVVHLVSLEGCENYLIDTALAKANIQLLSLASWSFNCLPEPKENFGALLTQLINSPQAGDNQSLLRYMPIADAEKNISADVLKRLENGYMPQLYHSRSGEKTIAWYRGPCTPIAETIINSLPNNSSSSESFMIYDDRTGMFDLSYAAAWEVGRSLALADAHFSQNLIKFRWQTHQQTNKFIYENTKQHSGGMLQDNVKLTAAESFISYLKNDLVKTIHTDFSKTTQPSLLGDKKNPEKISLQQKLALRNVTLQTQAQTGLAIPATLSTWLAQLRCLVGLPFNYLVADEKLLPKETIRFFHIDTNWLDTVVKGALSIGIHSSQDNLFNTLLLNQFQSAGFGEPDPVCGLLLRSAVVSGWPGLSVRINTDSSTTSIVNVLRQERLADDLLLCLFDGIPQQVSICEPQEQLCFGVSGDSLTTGFIELRNLTNNKAGFPFNSDPVLNQMLINDTNLKLLRPDSRVLNISALKEALKQRGVVASAGINSDFGAADLAVELVRAPEEVNFNISN
ncbi:hypothetical protein BH10PSE19_BH10PSE19_00750 [soil metagenome]